MSPSPCLYVCVCAAANLGLQDVKTWDLNDSGEVAGVRKIKVYVLLTGFMADSPMRNKIFKNVQWTGLRSCDFCTLSGEKGQLMSTKFFGCAVYRTCCSAIHARLAHVGSCVHCSVLRLSVMISPPITLSCCLGSILP